MMTKNKIMDLIDEYWDLAYQEGKYDVNRTNEVNRIIHELNKLTAAGRPARRATRGATCIDENGVFYDENGVFYDENGVFYRQETTG